jgi:hypothetical protein
MSGQQIFLATVNELGGEAQGFSPTPVKAAGYAALVGDYVPVDISGGSVAIALPAAPADKARVGVKIIAVSGTPGSTLLTINRGGADVFNVAGGSTSLTFSAKFQGAILQYKASTGIWYVQTTDTPLNAALGAALLGSDGTVGGPSGSVLSPSVVSSPTGASLSAGDDVTMFSSAVTPLMGRINDGTSADPVTVVGATFKVSRKEALTVAALEAVGGAGADGADVVAAVQGISEGQAESQTQTVGGYFGAKNKSNYGEGNPDACGLYAIGNITGGTAAKASGIGATLIGRREAGVGADINGAEIVVHNRGAEGKYASAGASDSRGIWLHAEGTADSGCAVNIGNPNGHKFQVGFGVPLQNGGAIKESVYRDDGESENSLDVRGKHAIALRTFSPAAGAVVIGHKELATPNALLEVMNDEAGRDPLVVFGSVTASQKYTQQLRNSVGSIRLFIGGAAEDFFAGSAAGDTGIEFTAGKALRIGAAGKTHKITVTEGGLSFYGVAPVVRHAAIAEPAETLAGLRAAVNGLRDALTKIGITE